MIKKALFFSLLVLLSACLQFDAPLPEFEKELLHNVILKGGNSEAKTSVWVGWTNYGPSGGYDEEAAARVLVEDPQGFWDTAVYDEDGFYYLDPISNAGETIKVRIDRPDGVFEDSLYFPKPLELQFDNPVYVGSFNGDTSYFKYRTDVQILNRDRRQKTFNLQLGLLFGSENTRRADYQSSNFDLIYLALPGAEAAWPARGLFVFNLEEGESAQISIYHSFEENRFIINTFSQSLFDNILNQVNFEYNGGGIISASNQDLGFAQTLGSFGWMHTDTILAP